MEVTLHLQPESTVHRTHSSKPSKTASRCEAKTLPDDQRDPSHWLQEVDEEVPHRHIVLVLGSADNQSQGALQLHSMTGHVLGQSAVSGQRSAVSDQRSARRSLRTCRVSIEHVGHALHCGIALACNQQKACISLRNWFDRVMVLLQQ